MQSLPRYIGCSFPGGPPTATQLLDFFVIPFAGTLPANMAGSYGKISSSGTNPTSSFVITVKQNGSSIGTITINTSGVYTFATSGGTAVTLAAGDLIEFFGPGTPDATAANLVWTIKVTSP
jgi:VCBS repeat-containing protein